MVRWVGLITLLIFFIFGNYNYVDIWDAIKYYGNIFSESQWGIFIFILLFLIVLFTDEIIIIYKKYIKKIKIKKKF